MFKIDLSKKALDLFTEAKGKPYPDIEKALVNNEITVVIELAIYLRAATIEELVTKLNDNNL